MFHHVPQPPANLDFLSFVAMSVVFSGFISACSLEIYVAGNKVDESRETEPQ